MANRIQVWTPPRVPVVWGQYSIAERFNPIEIDYTPPKVMREVKARVVAPKASRKKNLMDDEATGSLLIGVVVVGALCVIASAGLALPLILVAVWWMHKNKKI